ncbi:MAG: MBL fold metallo-hydrolase [Lachnospiraceae bacterium]
MQVLKDIYKLIGEEYRIVPNIYAVRSGESLILFDCGTNENDWMIARENMKYWGIDHLPITYAFITHAHADHAGYAAELQKRGTKIIAGEGMTALENRTDPRNFYYAVLHKPFAEFKPDKYVKDGEILEIEGLKIEVIEASGHSASDYIYRINMYGKVILFIGDVFHIAEYGMGAQIGNEWFVDSDYDKYMRTLFKLKDIQADVILSGHMQGCLKDAGFILKDAVIKAQEKFDGRWDKKSYLKSLELE